jgi:2,4-dienoyl-CoA reductase-like NADH-dependent reductase (Old Yellow Enzyme family)
VILLFQITHSGRNSNPAFSEKTTVCPGSTEGRLLTTDEIQEIKDLFVSASLLAEEAGADGVDFKCCHGYFGAEIIRPENTRSDCWGGSWENRTRFFREGVSELQAQKQNKNFIVGSRFSMYEGWRGGCGTTSPDSIIEDLSEMKLYIELMVKLGVDYANVSAGIPGRTSEITRPVKGSELMYLNHLRYTRFTKEVLRASNSDIKVIGSAYSVLKEDAFAVGEEMLEKEFADYIGWGRQILADPFTPNKLKNREEINFCTACSGCSKLMIKQAEVGCIMYNPYYKEIWKENLKEKVLTQVN